MDTSRKKEFVPPPHLLPTISNPTPVFTPTTTSIQKTKKARGFKGTWQRLKRLQNLVIVLTIAVLYFFPLSQPFVKPSVDYGIATINQLLNGNFPF